MRKLILYFLLFCSGIVLSQQSKEEKKGDDSGLVTDAPIINQVDLKMNPLAPAKAAFYSAILPGLGQAYNKKYWIIPVFYGGMVTSMYYYTINNNRYDEFVTAYKLDLQGKPHEFENLDRNALERGINGTKKNRDLSLFITIGIYILNVVEANVDAHLPNKKIDTNLSYQPAFTIDPVTNTLTYGASVSFRF